MGGRWVWTLPLASALGLLVGSAAVAGDWDDCDGWQGESDRGRYCEIRELTLPATGDLDVDAGRNGGIGVQGVDRSDVFVAAKITVSRRSEAEARRLASEIAIESDGGIVRARGPERNDWAVSYRIETPRQIDLDLEASNGGISVKQVDGRLRLVTHNGGLTLAGLAGDVEARTTNGGLTIELAGDSWEGKGLDVATTNGGVRLRLPDNYSAELETSTVNGGLSADVPELMHGERRRSIRATLGRGGAPVRVKTTNGAVKVTGG